MARPASIASKSRWLIAPTIALLATALLAWSGALARLDRTWYDALQRRLAPAALADNDTALVLIDEQSLEAMGSAQYAWRWPWPRQAFAGLLAALHRAGAKAVIVDLAFVELSNSEMDDMMLGAVAAGAPEITLASLGEKLPAIWPEDFPKQHAGLFASRRRWGSASVKPDADGVYRRYPMGTSLVGAALGRADAVASTALVRWRGTLADVRARGVPVLPAARFVAAGMTLLGPATENTPDFAPAALVRAIDELPITDEEIFARVRGRTVFVGANAAAAFDYIATPAGAPEAGVLLHWNAWQNFAGDEFLYEARPPVIAGVALLVVAAVAAAGRGALGLRRPAIVALGAGLLTVGGSALAFGRGFWLAPAAAVAGAAISFTAVAVESFRRERARKREIQGWFGSYVSPAVVKRLVENPDALKLGGERRDVSVFFSDLVGFTTLSEKLSAEKLVSLINLSLDELSGSIFDHGGYLDKYIGDAIMGVFGSPEELPNHALSATRAALDSQRRLLKLNERLAREYDGVQLGMRIGINTGDAVVGNVGSERKKNFTVLGDTVNLASRLEGANKEFHTLILLGPVTAARVSAEILTRPVARLRVKGKTQAVEVHEPLGEIAAADEPTRRFAAAAKEGFDAWSIRHFDEAVRALSEALVLRPGDFLTTRYLDDARRLAASPPPTDWEPILNLESK